MKSLKKDTITKRYYYHKTETFWVIHNKQLIKMLSNTEVAEWKPGGWSR